jgi:hypothetical protein
MRALRRFFLPAAFGVVAAAGFVSPAFAVCDVEGEMFYLHKNDVSKHLARTDASGCDLHFITGGGVTFRSAAIVAKPKKGDLRKIAHLEFRYRPKPGFRGSDNFSLRVCGRNQSGSGCSILHYTAQVD